jgi:hypothetical protein
MAIRFSNISLAAAGCDTPGTARRKQRSRVTLFHHPDEESGCLRLMPATVAAKID